jgi:hypothetical protein
VPKASRHSLPPAGELPGTLKRSPSEAQETFIRVLASAAQAFGDGDQAFRAAYAEFKRTFEKRGDHWIPKQPSSQSGKVVNASLSGLLGPLAHVHQARSRCLRCCPGMTMTTLARPPHRARGGHGPLRPELAAPLGVWPSSQLAECAAGRGWWWLCGDVAVLPCCTVYRISSAGDRGSDRFGLDQHA